MERIELRSSVRTVKGKQVKRLRSQGWVPAVLYGSTLPPKSLQLEEGDLYKTLQVAGATSLINLFVADEAEPYVVLAREIQRDVFTGRLQHVDFFQVQLDHKIKTMPYLEIVGESPLVSSGGAVLVQILNRIEVECLPTDLVHSIQVDISGLKKLDDSITIGDLPVPPGVTLLADPNDTVVSVVPPRAALAEEAAEEEEFLPEGVEVVGEVARVGEEDADEA